MKLKRFQWVLLSFAFLQIQCSHSQRIDPSLNSQAKISVAENRDVAQASLTDWIEQLPPESTADFEDYLGLITPKVAKGMALPAANPRVKSNAERIAKYVSFIMFKYDELHFDKYYKSPKKDPITKKAVYLIKEETEAEKKTRIAKERKASLEGAAGILPRLFASSTQFILCRDLQDFECLEKTPEITPSKDYRVEDAAKKLGAPRKLSGTLDSALSWFFTEQILKDVATIDRKKTLVNELERVIKTDGKDGIYMALYGIDDIKGSMAGVYQTLLSKIKSGVDVKGVFDQEGFQEGVSLPQVFTYLRPTNEAKAKRWILADWPLEIQGQSIEGSAMSFQYNEGTQGLIHALAEGANDDTEARGRIEWKDNSIMHNKFFVLKNGENFSVWSGTANVARTCMGEDRNSNMGIYIKNNEIAKTFLDEFNEMYEYSLEDGSAKIVGADGPKFQHGRFHTDKTPNTHRYFVFDEGTPAPKDDTDVRVFFSPTDDAEHRVILPMLLSAQKGDILRISMFGARGIELVRAMELALARGAKVEVILDTPTGSAIQAWANVTGEAHLFEQNPYTDSDVKVSLMTNDKGPGEAWKQNHQKIGLLLKKTADGYRAEQFIIGSQNWSAAGNDTSDENVVSFRNREKGLKIGEAFNQHFTTLLWPNAKKSIHPAEGGGDDEEEASEN